MSEGFFRGITRFMYLNGDFIGGKIHDAIIDAIIPQIPPTIQLSQVYSVAAQQNTARIGAPMPVLYGKFRVYPDLLSQPWIEYINNDQYLYQLMTVTQGQAEMLSLNIGDTPISSFANVTYRLYQPGETVDLFHNNVFTNNQVNDLTLVTIGAGTDPAALTFDAAAHTITCATGIFTSDVIAEGDLFAVSGSQLNDGTYTVGSISPDFKQIVVTGTLVDESPHRPTTYATVTNTTTSTVYGPARFDFSNVFGASKITATNPGTDGVDLSTISAGDTLVVSGSILNDGTYHGSSLVAATTSVVQVNEDLVAESASSPPDWQCRIIQLSKDVGPFYANIEGLNINAFSVDIVFPKGFYNSNDSGDLTNTSATLRVEWRKYGDAAFTLAADEVFTAAKNEAQRYTRTYSLPDGTEGLIEVKVTRISETANSSRKVNESHWAGLRGFVIAPTTLPANYDGPTIISNEHYQYPDRTVLAIKVRATGQLSNAMGKQFNGVFQRLIPTWDGAAWTDPVATSSIPWIFADVITNTQYGCGRPLSEINTTELAALDAVYAERGDEFNGYFDQQSTIFDALTQIALVGRAKPIFDGRTFSMIRDEPRTIRTGLFSDQNTIADSLKVAFDFMGEESPRGVLVTYWDGDTYVQKTLLCGEDINTTSVTLFGCTSRQQAWNEGNFLVNVNKYRRVNVSFDTEMDGFIPRNGDLVTLQTQWMNWGQSARVLSVDGLELTLDQSLDWSGTGYACILRDIDGAPSTAIDCAMGAASNVLVLAELPAFDIRTDGTQERTQITLGNTVTKPMDVLVNQISASDEFHASIASVVEDERVHADPGTAPIEYPSG